MPSEKIIVVIIIAVILITVIGILAMILLGLRKQGDDNYRTQHNLTDRELFRLISEQPDGVMTTERLAQSSGLTRKQAKSRMAYLHRNGLFKVHQGGMKYHYSLREEIDNRPPPEISDAPFLTVEDILILFKHYDYKLSYQKICIATGLPISVIKEELEYFIKQKIISKIYSVEVAIGVQPSSLFLLEEPYRSNTDKFLEREQEINLELEKIYIKETRS